MTKPQSTTQGVIGRRGQTHPRNELRHILWDKRKVLHHPLSGDATDGSQSATVMYMFVYKIKNWHVWACPFAIQSVTSWGTGGVFAWNVAFLFTTVGAVWRPKKGCKCKLFLKYEMNNENNFAVVATFVKRSRKIWNVNDYVNRQTNFVKMLLCRSDTVILILLQSGMKLTNWKCFVLYLKATIMSNCLFAFVKTW